jgi:hypothetical protein
MSLGPRYFAGTPTTGRPGLFPVNWPKPRKNKPTSVRGSPPNEPKGAGRSRAAAQTLVGKRRGVPVSSPLKHTKEEGPGSARCTLPTLTPSQEQTLTQGQSQAPGVTTSHWPLQTSIASLHPSAQPSVASEQASAQAGVAAAQPALQSSPAPPQALTQASIPPAQPPWHAVLLSSQLSPHSAAMAPHAPSQELLTEVQFVLQAVSVLVQFAGQLRHSVFAAAQPARHVVLDCPCSALQPESH